MIFIMNKTNVMKRYLILAAAAALVLGACSKNDIVKSEGTPVSFDTYVGHSKATTGPIDITALKASADGFGVYCYYTDTATGWVSIRITSRFMLPHALLRYPVRR